MFWDHSAGRAEWRSEKERERESASVRGSLVLRMSIFRARWRSTLIHARQDALATMVASLPTIYVRKVGFACRCRYDYTLLLHSGAVLLFFTPYRDPCRCHCRTQDGGPGGKPYGRAMYQTGGMHPSALPTNSSATGMVLCCGNAQ